MLSTGAQIRSHIKGVKGVKDNERRCRSRKVERLKLRERKKEKGVEVKSRKGSEANST
jgi:hypothetical protein